MNKPSEKVWDFVEQYLPYYYTNPDVLRQSELQIFLDGHDSTITDMSIEDARLELNTIHCQLYHEAIEACCLTIQSETQKNDDERRFFHCKICNKTNVTMTIAVNPNELAPIKTFLLQQIENDHIDDDKGWCMHCRDYCSIGIDKS